MDCPAIETEKKQIKNSYTQLNIWDWNMMQSLSNFQSLVETIQKTHHPLQAQAIRAFKITTKIYDLRMNPVLKPINAA